MARTPTPTRERRVRPKLCNGRKTFLCGVEIHIDKRVRFSVKRYLGCRAIREPSPPRP